MSIILDRQTNGVGPAATTDFWTPGNIYSFRNLGNRRRFKTLMDWQVNINAAAEPNSTKCFHKYLKFRKPIIVDYNAGTAGTVGDIASNGLFLVQMGSIAAGVNAGSNIINIRVRYTDM